MSTFQSESDRSRINNVLRNSKYGLASNYFYIFLAFVARTVFINTLGTRYLGVASLYTNILTVLSLAELGMGNVLAYSLYQPIADRDEKKISQILTYYQRVYFLIAGVVLVIGLCLIPFLHWIVKTSLPPDEVLLYYLFYLANSVVSYIGVCYTTYVKAKQQQYLADFISTFAKLVGVIGQIVVMVIWKSFIGYLVIMVFATLFQNLLIAAIAKKQNHLQHDRTALPTTEIQKIWDNVKSTFLYRIGIVAINYTDNILISVILGTDYVGLYTNYAMVVSQIAVLIGIFCNAIIAGIGNLSTESDTEKAEQVFLRLVFVYHFLTAIITIGFLMVFNVFICLWIGEKHMMGMDVVLAVTFTFYISNIINPVWMYREAYGLFKQIRYLMVITAAVNIALSIIGGNLFGVAGIVAATGVARCLTTVWYEPRVLYKQIFRKSPLRYWRKQLRYFLSTCIAGALVCAIRYAPVGGRLMTLPRMVQFLCMGSICVIVTVLVFVGVNYRTEEWKYWWNFAKKVLKNRGKYAKH